MEHQRAVVVLTRESWMWVTNHNDRWEMHVEIPTPLPPPQSPVEAFAALSGWPTPNHGSLRYARPVELVGVWDIEALIVESYAIIDLIPKLGYWVSHTLQSGAEVQHYVVHRSMGTVCGLVLPKHYEEIPYKFSDTTCQLCITGVQSLTDHWRV